MEELDPTLVSHLQAMARRGAATSEMLRDLARTLGPKASHKLTLINYMRKAFGLSLQEASPIAGWCPDGTGQLPDSRLDEFLNPAIQSHLA
jgi:hypothetical protein